MKTNKLTIDGDKVTIGYQEIHNMIWFDASIQDDGSYNINIKFNTGVNDDEEK